MDHNNKVTHKLSKLMKFTKSDSDWYVISNVLLPPSTTLYIIMVISADFIWILVKDFWYTFRLVRSFCLQKSTIFQIIILPFFVTRYLTFYSNNLLVLLQSQGRQLLPEYMHSDKLWVGLMQGTRLQSVWRLCFWRPCQ